jgi:uncharacterized protein involved in exopolysaccharide biosynthesis
VAKLAGFQTPAAQLSIIEKAQLPDGPVDSHEARYAGGGFAAGALLAALMASVRRRTSRRAA